MKEIKNNMKSDINCKFCSNSNLEKIYTPINSKRKAEIFLCNSCGLLQTVYKSKEFPKVVSISCDADWGNIRHGKKSRLQPNLNFITKKVNFSLLKHCLDIGSNRGDFVKWLNNSYPNIKITAIEPDTSLIDYENKKIEVIPHKFESVDLDKKYDFIYCCHTLEHIDSLKNFLNNCYRILKKEGFLFIEVPNTEIIAHDENIVEEFFIDKHTIHLIPETLINIFNCSGFDVISKEINPYNISILLKKNIKKPSFLLFDKIIKKEKHAIDVYQKNIKNNRILLKRICEEKLQSFLKRQKVGFWGASRIFDAFIKYGGISKDLVYILVDKFISQILKEIYGIPVMDPLWLKIYEPHVVFVLARSSAHKIQNTAHEMGFRWVVTFDELMEQARLI